MKTPHAPPRRPREPAKRHHPFVLALDETLRKAQRRRGISDTKLAAGAGVVTATVGNLARGFCDPKASTLWLLCQALRADIGEVSTAALDAAIDTTALNPSGIGAFGGNFSDPPTQSEMQSFAAYVESLRVALTR